MEEKKPDSIKDQKATVEIQKVHEKIIEEDLTEAKATIENKAVNGKISSENSNLEVVHSQEPAKETTIMITEPIVEPFESVQQPLGDLSLVIIPDNELISSLEQINAVEQIHTIEPPTKKTHTSDAINYDARLGKRDPLDDPPLDQNTQSQPTPATHATVTRTRHRSSQPLTPISLTPPPASHAVGVPVPLTPARVTAIDADAVDGVNENATDAGMDNDKARDLSDANVNSGSGSRANICVNDAMADGRQPLRDAARHAIDALIGSINDVSENDRPIFMSAAKMLEDRRGCLDEFYSVNDAPDTDRIDIFAGRQVNDAVIQVEEDDLEGGFKENKTDMNQVAIEPLKSVTEIAVDEPKPIVQEENIEGENFKLDSAPEIEPVNNDTILASNFETVLSKIDDPIELPVENNDKGLDCSRLPKSQPAKSTSIQPEPLTSNIELNLSPLPDSKLVNKRLFASMFPPAPETVGLFDVSSTKKDHRPEDKLQTSSIPINDENNYMAMVSQTREQVDQTKEADILPADIKDVEYILAQQAQIGKVTSTSVFMQTTKTTIVSENDPDSNPIYVGRNSEIEAVEKGTIDLFNQAMVRRPARKTATPRIMIEDVDSDIESKPARLTSSKKIKTPKVLKFFKEDEISQRIYAESATQTEKIPKFDKCIQVDMPKSSEQIEAESLRQTQLQISEQLKTLKTSISKMQYVSQSKPEEVKQKKMNIDINSRLVLKSLLDKYKKQPENKANRSRKEWIREKLLLDSSKKDKVKGVLKLILANYKRKALKNKL